MRERLLGHTKATAEVALVSGKKLIFRRGAVELLYPVLFFLFRGYVQFDRVETHYFQGRTAIRAFDNVSFISLLVHLNFGIAFRTGSSWHLFIPP